MVKDERDRWSADQLLEHGWIKHRMEHLQSPLHNANHLIQDEADNDAIKEPFNDSVEDAEKPLPFNWIGNANQSRLQSEFSYLCHLGKGGFGEVFKAKNNLDSRIYAIKRIKLEQKNKQLTRKLRREVELLSRLNHENVVRYYNSWIEIAPEESRNDDSDDSHSDEESSDILVAQDNSLSISFIGGNGNEDDGDDIFGTSFLPFSDNNQDWSDDDIIFERSDDEESHENRVSVR